MDLHLLHGQALFTRGYLCRPTSAVLCKGMITLLLSFVSIHNHQGFFQVVLTGFLVGTQLVSCYKYFTILDSAWVGVQVVRGRRCYGEMPSTAACSPGQFLMRKSRSEIDHVSLNRTITKYHSFPITLCHPSTSSLFCSRVALGRWLFISFSAWLCIHKDSHSKSFYGNYLFDRKE